MKTGLLSILGLAIGALCITGCETGEVSDITPISGDTLSYLIFFGEREAGEQRSWVDHTGDLRYFYEFNDRGRGPRYEERIRLDDAGTLVYQEIIGHDYLKDSIHETFQVADRTASWTNKAEAGSATFSGEKHYSSLAGSFANLETLVRRLMTDPDGKLDLLPAGEAQLLETVPLEADSSLHLDMMVIGGLGFNPSYLWMDDQQRFFASVSEWLSCIRSGQDHLKPQLLERQKEHEDARFAQLAAELTEIPENPVAIANARLFDPETSDIIEGATVVFEREQIIALGASSEVTIPENARVIDAQGKTLMPGLWDMHVHINKAAGALHLAAGVTSVRDMANSLTLPELKKQMDEDEILGPRIARMCGFIDGAGPYAGPTGKIINTVEEGKAGIEEYKSLGYDQIKLYSSIRPEWVKPLTDKAHELGMEVSGHIPAFMLAEEAVRAGYDEIQHANMLMLNFFPDTIDTRTPLRFTVIAQEGAGLDYSSDRFADFIDLLRENDIVVDPTVAIFEGMFTARPGTPNPAFAPIIDRLPVQVRSGFMTGGLPVPEGMDKTYQAAHAKMLELVKILHDNDITIVPGTDALAGFALHRELELYHKAGIPADEVLKLATITSARVAGAADMSGSLQVGKMADLILVDGRPDENISDIRNVTLTIRGGRIYDPSKLYQAIGVRVGSLAD
jgi:imidazolonepropionase-like amidohydrolase